MNNRKYGLYWLLLFILILPAQVFARSVDGFSMPSTPFMYPTGFACVPYLFIVLFLTANFLFINKKWQISKLQAAKTVLFVCFIILFVSYIIMPMQYYPGISDLRINSRPFYGAFSGIFLFMNIITLIIINSCSLIMSYFHPYMLFTEEKNNIMIASISTLIAIFMVAMIENYISLFSSFLITSLLIAILAIMITIKAFQILKKQAFTIILINSAVYLVSISPYMITGALEHGSGPSMECNHRFTYKMSAALIEYCRKNNGYLPEGKTIIQVSDELQPYYNQFSGSKDLMKENLICKAGRWYEKEPLPYTWNADLAGKSIKDLRKMKKQVMIITCLYHKKHYISTDDLIKAYDDPKEIFINVWKHK